VTRDASDTAHVSSDGDDRAPGTAGAPFATVGRACDWLVETRKQAPDAELTIRLHAGRHRLDRPLAIGADACGRNGAKTIVRGDGRDRTFVTGCTVATARPAIEDANPSRRAQSLCRLHFIDLPARSEAPLDLGTLGFGLPQLPAPPALFVDGKRLSWTRSRVAPSLHGSVVASERRAWKPFRRRRRDGLTLAVDRRVLADSRPEDDLWIEMVIGESWRWFMAHVERIDRSRGLIVTSLPEATGTPGQSVCQIALRNGSAQLEPGHAVLDARRRRILFALPDSADAGTADVEFCANPGPLIRLTGASNVELADLGLYGGLASAILVDRSDRVAIGRCHIRDFGLGGIDATGSAIEISDCEIHHVGTGGIRLRSGNAAELRPGSSLIARCEIHDWAEWKRVYEPAIRLHGVGSRVTDCAIHDGPHMALTFDGNDHVVARNRFARVARDFADMGAIYIDLGDRPLMRGIVIAGNVFHDIGACQPLTHAIYVDRASFGVRVAGNLFVRVGGPSRFGSSAIYANGPSDLVIDRNLFVDCRTALILNFYLADWGHIDLERAHRAWRETNVRLEDPQLPHHRAYPELARFQIEDRILPPSNRFVENAVRNHAVAPDPAGAWQVRYGPAELVELRGNQLVGDPRELASDRVAILELIAGRSPDDAQRAVDQACIDWPAVAARLRLDNPSAI